MRRGRGCCYCCCGTRRRTLSCLLCMAIFVVVAVVVCYFFIPRKPTICVTVEYPDNFSASTEGFNVSIPLNISVANPNYYGFSLEQVTVNLVYKVPTPLGSGTNDTPLATITAPDIHIRARGNSTNILPVNIQTNADTADANAQILKDCTLSGTTTLYINAALTLLKRIHITIPDQAVKIQCSPVTPVGAATLLPGAVAGLAKSNGTLGDTYCKKASW